MDRDPFSKKQQLRTFLILYFGTLAFIFIVMLVFAGEVFWEPLMYIAIGWFFFLLIITLGTLFWMNRNKEKIIKMNSPENQGQWAIGVILFGAYLIITSFSSFDQIKIFLIKAGFGLLSIIWGLYYLKKNKI